MNWNLIKFRFRYTYLVYEKTNVMNYCQVLHGDHKIISGGAEEQRSRGAVVPHFSVLKYVRLQI